MDQQKIASLFSGFVSMLFSYFKKELAKNCGRFLRISNYAFLRFVREISKKSGQLL